ncbi:hypothetical protein J7E99_13260 [Streptomyces sp. ISL-44]|uniref:hypothetical protein n=1 Tax=Streptomyces sp. ISL-44 TaxID=2819184 RepID=UPI001BECEBBF|nr:hypothetical protein [Streptomyces sp. ISL-44]MBT2541649.1 hypothetical protein [Streptomyces sp. ISL-44]
MTLNEAGQLREEAHRLRRALDEALAAGEFADHPVLVSFPSGTCGLISEFVCQYLRDRGLGSWEYVPGERHSPSTGEWQGTHGWARQGQVVIDLTADQFDGEGRPPVWAGESDDWYRSWEEGNSRVPEDVETDGMDRAAYEVMLRYARKA